MQEVSNINWYWRSFDELTTEQLYDLLQLRQAVFVVEQQCIYLDIDGVDKNCLHLLAYVDNKLSAYLRVIPADLHDSGHIAIGRVLSKTESRGSGIALKLMLQTMEYLQQHFPNQTIQLAAQCYLKKFYQKFGFTSIGEPYDEDGIMHIDMIFNRG